MYEKLKRGGSLKEDLKGAWKSLQGLKDKRERIVNDSSFVPKIEDAEPMLVLIHDLELIIQNLAILYHQPLEKEPSAELAEVLVFHEQNYERLYGKVQQEIQAKYR